MRNVFSYIFFILISNLILLGCDSNSVKVKSAIAEVQVALPLKQKIIEWDEYTGRFQAIEEVDIRSRVTGYLTAIKFQDGQLVKKGDVLFVIDQRPFQNMLVRAQSQERLAKIQYQRTLQLNKKKFIAAEAVDQRLQGLQVAQTNVQEAKINLEFTEIKAPIDGKVSRNLISVGNLIRMDDTILTKIVSLNPIYFYFEMSQAELLKYKRLEQGGKKERIEHESNAIYIKLPDEDNYVHVGQMDFQDNTIDESTGTILARAIVLNPKLLIYPGLFGRVKVAGSSEYEALLLPDKVIHTEQTNKFVYVVDKENKLQRKQVELGALQENGFYIIRHGLRESDLVVLHTLQRTQTVGQTVKPFIVSLTEGSI